MKTIALLILAAMTAACSAQTAKVIVLTPDETVQMVQLTQQKEAIEKKIDNLHDQITKKYLFRANHPCDPKASFCLACFYVVQGSCPVDGWAYGFIFSDDYKYIVPAPVPVPAKDGIIPGGSPYFSINPAHLQVGEAGR